MAVGGLLVIGAIAEAVGQKTPPSKPAAAASQKAVVAATPPTTPSAVATSAPARTTTAQQVFTWYHNGGQNALNAIVGVMGTISADIQAQNYSAVGQDCGQLSTDIVNAESAGPIPYHRAEKWWARALSKYDQAAAQCQAGASTQDASAIQRAGTDLNEGNADLARATSAIRALSGA